jgi:tetratricopeptide (TPR) repeat protein
VTRPHPLSRVLPAALLLVAAGCAQVPADTSKPAPAAPQITEGMLRDRAREQLVLGIKQYEAGDFESAPRSLGAALDHGLLSKVEQSTVRKHLAFIHCVSNREAQCRDEFRKAFEINPEFSLAAAEDGHPIWGPVYRDVRTRLISEREAVSGKPAGRGTLGRAEQLLADALVQYDSGDYESALRLLESAQKDGLKDKSDQVRAMKHAAFSLCLLNRFAQCRAQFVKIYDVDPAFDLTAAEAGHPSWTRTFATAKAQAKKALADKAGRDARGVPVAPAPATPKR